MEIGSLFSLLSGCCHLSPAVMTSLFCWANWKLNRQLFSRRSVLAFFGLVQTVSPNQISGISRLYPDSFLFILSSKKLHEIGFM